VITFASILTSFSRSVVSDQCFTDRNRTSREVIDRVRVDEANRPREDKKARKVVKSARWLLLWNRKNISKAEDRIRLKELLAANRKLATVLRTQR
jgi:hypothetical protein